VLAIEKELDSTVSVVGVPIKAPGVETSIVDGQR
jgi:hypothetical protein